MKQVLDHPVLCTSLAQADALLKAGIDKQTADMTWCQSRFTPKAAYGEDQYHLFSFPEATTSHDPVGVPCWSVNGLMNALPRTMPDPLNPEHELRLTIQPSMSAWTAFYADDGRVGETAVEVDLIAALVSLYVKIKK
jgi:hypothetical protein